MKHLGLMLSCIIWSNIASAGEWVDINLNQIELTPSTGWNTPEGVWFAKDTPYQTSYNCEKNRYVSVKDKVLADRTLALALYAKSTGAKLKIHVTGCDSQGYLNGASTMLVN